MACCSLTQVNTGRASLEKVFGVAQRLVFVKTIATDGTRNAIPVGQDLSTYFSDQVSNADPSKRWYPVGNFKGAADARADAVYETFSDDTRGKLRDGVRSFTGAIVNVPSDYLGKVKQFECGGYSVYAIDACGNLAGEKSADGQFLFPVLISEGSFSAQYQNATDDAVARIAVNFDYDQSVLDQNIELIDGGLWGESILRINGLVDATAKTPANISTTGFDVTIEVDHTGSFINKIPVEGLVLADFTLNNKTTGLPIVITSVTESAVTEGLYTFVIPAQSSTDVLELTGLKAASGTVSGFEIAPIEITIP